MTFPPKRISSGEIFVDFLQYYPRYNACNDNSIDRRYLAIQDRCENVPSKSPC